VFKGIAYWLCADGILVSKDKGATWERLGETCPGTIGPMFDPKHEKHLVVAGAKGIFETTDGAKTWTQVIALPPKYDVPTPPGGWFTNVAWDAAGDVFYISRMGQAALKWERKAAHQ
jgi:photosystem II stability/assembly factor-like uncharacterized protein